MSQEIPKNPSPEEIKRLKEEQEYKELCADYLAIHPDPVISPENLREAGPEITELETMVASFESSYSLAELHAVVDISPDLGMSFEYAYDLADPKRTEENLKKLYEKDNPKFIEVYKQRLADVKAIILTSEDAKIYKMRMAAAEALKPITAMLDTLEKKTNISAEKLEEIKEKSKLLTRAVGGVIKGKNKISHIK